MSKSKTIPLHTVLQHYERNGREQIPEHTKLLLDQMVQELQSAPLTSAMLKDLAYYFFQLGQQAGITQKSENHDRK